MRATTALETVRRFLDSFETGRLDELRELCAPDVRWLDERTGRWATGVEPLIEYNRAGLEGSDGMRVELRDAATVEDSESATVSGALIFRARWSGQPYEILCPSTFVLARDGDRWWIRHEHALEYRPRTEG